MGLTEEKNSEALKNVVDQHYGMILDCDMYKKDYKNCSCFAGKFNQYFIFGKFLDCNQKKSNWNNCVKCVEGDHQACSILIHNDNNLKEERMKNHLANDVWERRKEPPSEWDAKLPEWIEKNQADSFLHAENSFCTIF